MQFLAPAILLTSSAVMSFQMFAPSVAISSTDKPVLPVGFATINRDTENQKSIPVGIVSGRNTLIDFSETDEAILSDTVSVGDSSHFVYALDTQDRQAKTVTLRPIEGIVFPGTTTNKITNLSLTTIDRSGNRRLYVFNIEPSKSRDYLGVKIVDPNGLSQPFLLEGRPVSPQDVSRGLSIAIERKLTPSDDRIVSKVQNVLTAMEQGVPIRVAAVRENVSPAIIVKLAQIANERPKVLPFRPRTPPIVTPEINTFNF